MYVGTLYEVVNDGMDYSTKEPSYSIIQNIRIAVSDNIENLPSDRKGLFRQLELLIVKVIRWATARIEQWVRPKANIRYRELKTIHDNINQVDNKLSDTIHKVEQEVSS
jgi:hypothetical protein